VETLSLHRSCRCVCEAVCSTALIVALIVISTTGCRQNKKVQLTISVAASLTGTIEKVETNYIKEHQEVTFQNNFGSSGALAQQIEQGAPVDLFLAAGLKPMNMLKEKNSIDPAQTRNLLLNHLVMIVPSSSNISSLESLNASTVHRIALGEPLSVPAGTYAMQSLKSAGLDHALAAKFVFAKDVRQVLAYVASGNVDAGFVYATDARANSQVRVAQTVDDKFHEPILYPLGIVAKSANSAQARAFAAYLATPEAASVFAEKGFDLASHP